MSKQTRKERKKQEAEMLAEFDKELEKGRETDGQMRTARQNASTDKVHCKRCKTLMEKGVCPICGYKIYVPMTDEKRKKVRFIVTCVCLVAFVVLYAFIKK